MNKKNIIIGVGAVAFALTARELVCLSKDFKHLLHLHNNALERIKELEQPYVDAMFEDIVRDYEG